MSAASNRLPGSLLDFERVFGVSLNGRPARLDVTRRGMVEVKSDRDRAVFNAGVAVAVCQRHKGSFVTKEARV